VRDTADEWHMGDTDSDGTVICWGAYGRDLGQVIDSL